MNVQPAFEVALWHTMFQNRKKQFNNKCMIIGDENQTNMNWADNIK